MNDAFGKLMQKHNIESTARGYKYNPEADDDYVLYLSYIPVSDLRSYDAVQVAIGAGLIEQIEWFDDKVKEQKESEVKEAAGDMKALLSHIVSEHREHEESPEDFWYNIEDIIEDASKRLGELEG